MTEIVGNGNFIPLTVSSTGNFVNIRGTLSGGSLAIGWKTVINNKEVEVTNIFLSAIDKETYTITVKGVSADEIIPGQMIEFKTMIL